MKICFWGNIAKGFYGKPIGGGEKQLFLISSELSKRGNNISIIDFDVKEDMIIDNVNIISLKKFSSENKLNKYLALYKLMKIINSDIYYSRIRSSIHLIGLFAAKKNNKKFIYHSAHDLDSATFKERINLFYSLIPGFKKRVSHLIHSEILFPIMLRKSDLIFAQNKEQLKRYKKKYTKTKTLLINNLFDFDSEKTETKITPTYDFVTIGSLDLRKGIKELFKIITELPQKKFLIVGKPRDKNGETFVSRIKKLNNVTYYTSVDQPKVLELLNDSKFLLNASTGEGFPNVFLESWSTGTPVLSLNVNPSDVIDEFCLGNFYNGDIEKMKNDLMIVSPESFEASKMHLYLKNNHGVNKISEEIETILKTLVGLC